METSLGGFEVSAPEVRKARRVVEADAFSMSASTRAPTEATSGGKVHDASKFGSSPWSEYDDMCGSASIDALGRIEDEGGEADELFEDAGTSFRGAFQSRRNSPLSSNEVDFEALDALRGGFAEVTSVDKSLFDMDVELSLPQGVDMLQFMNFEDMDKVSGFDVPAFDVGARNISFDFLPCLQEHVSAQDLDCMVPEVSGSAVSTTSVATEVVLLPTPPAGERPASRPHLRRRAREASTPTPPGAEDAASSRAMSRNHSEASSESLAGAAGAALLRFRRMGRN